MKIQKEKDTINPGFLVSLGMLNYQVGTIKAIWYFNSVRFFSEQ